MFTDEELAGILDTIQERIDRPYGDVGFALGYRDALVWIKPAVETLQDRIRNLEAELILCKRNKPRLRISRK
jgi:hypothetical protein